MRPLTRSRTWDRSYISHSRDQGNPRAGFPTSMWGFWIETQCSGHACLACQSRKVMRRRSLIRSDAIFQPIVFSLVIPAPAFAGVNSGRDPLFACPSVLIDCCPHGILVPGLAACAPNRDDNLELVVLVHRVIAPPSRISPRAKGPNATIRSCVIPDAAQRRSGIGEPRFFSRVEARAPRLPVRAALDRNDELMAGNRLRFVHEPAK